MNKILKLNKTIKVSSSDIVKGFETRQYAETISDEHGLKEFIDLLDRTITEEGYYHDLLYERLDTIINDNITYCAIAFAECGEYQRAIKLIMKALDAHRKTDLIMRKLGWLVSLMLEQKTETDRLKIINKYLKNDPKFFVYLLKYKFYIRAAEHEKVYEWNLSELKDIADKMYSRILEEEPETDVDVVIKSNVLSTQSDHDATIKFCEDMRAVLKRNLIEEEKINIKFAEELEEPEYEDEKIIQDHKNMLIHQGRYRPGITDNISQHLQITEARAYKRQGKLPKALKIFLQIEYNNAENGVTDTPMLREIAKICEEMGDEKGALDTYEMILNNDQDDWEILRKVIHLRKKRHETDSAWVFLKRLHRLYPNRNSITIEYANLLMEKTEYREARDLYEPIAEQYDPDETNEDAKIARLHKAECMLQLGYTRAAHKIFRGLVRDDNKFKEAFDGLAIAAMELGKRDEAKKASKKAASLEKYEFSRDAIEPERIEGMQLTPTTATKGTIERTISKGKNVVQKPTFLYNPKTKKLDKGIEKTFVSNTDSLLNSDGGVIQIGITEKKPTGLFNDLKLLPKAKRTLEEFEKKYAKLFSGDYQTLT